MNRLKPEQIASYLEAIDVLGGVVVANMDIAMQIADARPGAVFKIENCVMTKYHEGNEVQVELVDDADDGPGK